MKKFSSLILAAILGSGITIGVFRYTGIEDSKSIKIEHISNTPVQGAAYTVDEKGELVPLQFTDVAENVMPSVVHIKSTQIKQMDGSNQPMYQNDLFREFFGPDFFNIPQQRGPQTRVGSGSGVIISKEGYIVTNNHVIDNADDIEVTLHNNRVYKAKIIGTDPSTDLALIQIKEKDLPAASFVNSDNVKVGEWVLAVGNPFNLNSTVTAGIVSAKARNINILHDKSAIESFIQTDAAINPGNSGGALVNLQGGLIGINTAIASPTGSYTGYGFAVPSNIVNKVVEDLLKYGMVQRGFLGVMIRNINGNFAKEKDLKVTEGVYVDSVMANSAAGESGIKEGDVIKEVNGVTIKSTGELLELIGRHRPGDEVNLMVDRFGKMKEFKVTLKNLQGKTKLAEKGEMEILDVLGVELEEVDNKIAKKLDIEGGLKIKKLHPGKLKKYTDVREGFIITKIDGKQVTSPEELVNLLKNKEGGVMIEGVYEDYPGKYYYAFGL